MRKRIIFTIITFILVTAIAAGVWFVYQRTHPDPVPKKAPKDTLSAAQKEEIHTKYFGNKIIVLIDKSLIAPQQTLIKVDSAVEWMNTDAANHQIVTDDGTTITAAASPVLTPGKSFTFVFKKAGTYAYHDNLHPEMQGTVTVK